jgi:hypothetical protein
VGRRPLWSKTFKGSPLDLIAVAAAFLLRESRHGSLCLQREYLFRGEAPIVWTRRRTVHKSGRRWRRHDRRVGATPSKPPRLVLVVVSEERNGLWLRSSMVRRARAGRSDVDLLKTSRRSWWIVFKRRTTLQTTFAEHLPTCGSPADGFQARRANDRRAGRHRGPMIEGRYRLSSNPVINHASRPVV